MKTIKESINEWMKAVINSTNKDKFPITIQNQDGITIGYSTLDKAYFRKVDEDHVELFIEVSDIDPSI